MLRGAGRVYIDNVSLRSDPGWEVFESHRAIPADRRPAWITRTSTPQELATYLQRAGFRDVQSTERGPWVRSWGVR